jgi:hypothetical protein
MTYRLVFLALILAVPALGRAETTAGQVKSVTGDATIVMPSGHVRPVIANMTVPPGSVIHTSSGTVGIHLMPGADTVVAPQTDVRIGTLNYSKNAAGAASRTVVLDLRKGTVFNDLVHGDGVSDFRVKTPKGVAAARGTIWSVTVVSGEVTIKVLRGEVVLITAKITVTIPGGHSFTTTTNLLAILSPQEVQQVVKEFTQAGFTVTVTGNAGGGGGGGGGGNPGNTTSPEQ